VSQRLAEGLTPGLYVVATPIGNLGDVTLRAIEILRGADRVLAEDTRRTRALLSHLGVAGQRVDRFDAHASPGDVERVVADLIAGAAIALVSDAGTPAVSDPGDALVAAAASAGARVIPVPGASAVMAAVSASGLVPGAFRFVGFLPRSGDERRVALAGLRDASEAVILFEAKGRAEDTLAELAQIMPGRRAAVFRELTKLHEEISRGTLAALAEGAAGREWLGEVTIVLGPAEPSAAPAGVLPSDDELDRRIDAELAAGRRAKQIAEQLALETGRPRRELYGRVVDRRR
jgi:16S rRNA (cytidine1402-2'-O)-methyltransferase